MRSNYGPPGGELTRRILLQKPVYSRDTTGGFVTAWEDVAHVWANPQWKINEVGDELISDQIHYRHKLEITMRYRSDIENSWRVQYNDDLWNIESVLQLGIEDGTKLVLESGVVEYGD